jgi:ornithine cyclodeaminase/alanine dehydrogenase-like protein (mu-crystallin family)
LVKRNAHHHTHVAPQVHFIVQERTMTRYIDVNDIRQLLRTIGPETFIHTLADYIRADYLRWPQFDKSPRTAAHSPEGVIELMPVHVLEAV